MVDRAAAMWGQPLFKPYLEDHGKMAFEKVDEAGAAMSAWPRQEARRKFKQKFVNVAFRSKQVPGLSLVGSAKLRLKASTVVALTQAEFSRTWRVQLTGCQHVSY